MAAQSNPVKALGRQVTERPIAEYKGKNFRPYRKLEREFTMISPRKNDPGSGRTAKRKSEKARSSGR
jgi:hypothetical protein